MRSKLLVDALFGFRGKIRTYDHDDEGWTTYDALISKSTDPSDYPFRLTIFDNYDDPIGHVSFDNTVLTRLKNGDDSALRSIVNGHAKGVSGSLVDLIVFSKLKFEITGWKPSLFVGDVLN